MAIAAPAKQEHVIAVRCESGNVRRNESIGFYGEPCCSWFLPMWSPDSAHNLKACQLLEATFPQWARDMIREKR